MGWSYIPTTTEARKELSAVVAKSKRGETAYSYEETYQQWAATTCAICKKPLGRGVKYYGIPDQGTGEHAVCVWKQAEQARAPGGAS